MQTQSICFSASIYDLLVCTCMTAPDIAVCFALLLCGFPCCRHSYLCVLFCRADYPPCSSGISLTPTFGSIYGGTPITVTLPEQRDYLLTSNVVMVDILCIFDQVQTRGMAISANAALCVSPPMTKLGFVPFQFRIMLGNELIIAANNSFLASKCAVLCIHR